MQTQVSPKHLLSHIHFLLVFPSEPDYPIPMPSVWAILFTSTHAVTMTWKSLIHEVCLPQKK